MLQIIGALAALGILVAVHEGGHFLAARFLGVEVEKFSIGFGPKILGYKGKQTEYRLSIIPLGGYVKMKGENPDEADEVDTRGSFLGLIWWKRALIAFAGPFTNLIFALLLLIITFLAGKSYVDYSAVIGRIEPVSSQSVYSKLNQLQTGDELLMINNQEISTWTDSYEAAGELIESVLINRNNQEIMLELDIQPADWFKNVLPRTTTIIGEVSPGLPAYNAGLLAGDKILAINGNPVSDWYELREEIQKSTSETVEVQIERANGRFIRVIKLQENLLDGNFVIGVTQQLPETVYETYSLGESIRYGSIATLEMLVMNYVGLYKLVMKPAELKNNIGGPVLMYTMSRETARHGWNSIISFVAMISLILMVMNLLPIPVLDGGMIMFCFIEGIRKKALSLKTQMLMQKIGASLLILLMFFAFSNDFSRLFKRSASISSQTREINEQEQMK